MNTTETINPVYPPKPQKPTSALLRITAIFLMLYGVFFFSAFLEDIITGNYEGGKAHLERKENVKADSTFADNEAEDTTLGVILGLFLACGMLPLGLSGFSFYIIHRRTKAYHHQADAWFENAILRFASLQKGKLTIPDVSDEFHIGVSESKKHLDQLVVKNVADVFVSESGEMIYIIRGYEEIHSGAEPVL